MKPDIVIICADSVAANKKALLVRGKEEGEC
jgi:hypothetical protein